MINDKKNNMKDYDSLFDSYDYDKARSNYSFINIEEFTSKHIKKYSKSIGKNSMHNFFICYRLDISNTYNIDRLKQSIKQLKDSYNIYMSDVYYDSEYLCKNYTLESYLRYSNKKLNSYIKGNL